MHKDSTSQIESKLVVSAILVGLVILVIISGIYVSNHLQSTDFYSQLHVTTSTEHAQTKSVAADISQISEIDKHDPAFTLADSEVLLVMRLRLTNRTTTEQYFIPTANLYVRTGQGDYRPLHPSVFVKNQIFSGTLKPGQTIEGQVSFSVPRTATNPLLYIDTGWNAEVPIVFSPLK